VKILCCVGADKTYRDFPRRLTGDVTVTSDPVTSPDADFIISYGYRHIFTPYVCKAFEGRIINIHLSLLPFNKGADPVMWGFVDGTPQGVTIHQVTEGIDDGDILAGHSYSGFDGDTLASAYWKLRAKAERLFDLRWPDIKAGNITPRPQPEGTRHYASDRKRIWKHLPLGYQTPVETLIDIGCEIRESADFWDQQSAA